MLYAIWTTKNGYTRNANISDMLKGEQLKAIPDDAVIIEAVSLGIAEAIYDSIKEI